MDREASWEKLAEAVPKVGGYEEATADTVWEKARKVHICTYVLSNEGFL